jgi:hypothetical protein
MPRIKTTRTARVALWALRIYLLILLSLIGLKFTRVFSGSGKDEKPPTTAPAQTNDLQNPSR